MAAILPSTMIRELASCGGRSRGWAASLTTSPAADVVVLGAGLFLLGLGWSCTLIAGSTMVTDELDADERPSVQGLSDLVMNASGAVGGIIAGIIVIGAIGLLADQLVRLVRQRVCRWQEGLTSSNE